MRSHFAVAEAETKGNVLCKDGNSQSSLVIYTEIC